MVRRLMKLERTRVNLEIDDLYESKILKPMLFKT
jgi:hypothetical protein